MNNLDLWIPDSAPGITFATTMKGSLFTEKHAQELKKSMKDDFEGIKNEMKEALRKLTEEDFEEMKNQIQEDLKKVTEEYFDGMKGEIEGMKKIAEENFEKMKNDFERQKKEIKTDFQKLSKDVLDRDRLTKEVELLKKENARLKKNKPQEFNEERYILIKTEPFLH